MAAAGPMYADPVIYRFGSLELDLAKAELRTGGELLPVEPQVFAVLAFLVEHRERVVSRDELLEKVWDGRYVTDSALSSRVKSARKAVGDDGSEQRVIRTIHGRGYRFVAEVSVERTSPPGLILPATPSVLAVPDAIPTEAAGTSSRPSLAVLPFAPLATAPRYAMVAEGLPHDLIIELSRLRWLIVTARGSSFRFREVPPDTRTVGRLLDVRYCLSGTVEIRGQRLTVTAELAETQNGRVVWAERYTGSMDDVHAVRAEISSQILGALEIQIPLHEAERARLGVPEHLDAWAAYHLGLQHVYRFNRRDNAAAAALFERAIALDPRFARAHAGLSFVHFQTAFLRQSEDIAGEIARARGCAERGLALDALDPFVNFTMGRSFWLEGDLEHALTWLERATDLSPSYAQGIYARGWTETLAGRGQQGREHVDIAMRLSPLDPLHYAMLGTRALAHLLSGENAEAADWAERAARSPGAHVLIAMIAAVAHGLAGSRTRAQIWVDNVRERNSLLRREDFLRAFPIKPEDARSRVSAALEQLGF